MTMKRPSQSINANVLPCLDLQFWQSLYTQFMYAINHMNSELYLVLVKDDTDVLKGMGQFEDVRDQRTPENNTVLHLACQRGSIGCVNQILTTHESLLFQTNLRGDTALHLAATHGHYDVVEALIIKAKSWNEEPNNLEKLLQNLIRAVNLELETALHVAVRHNHEKVVELLVKEDPSYSYPRNKYDETPLYLAAARCYAGVTKVILGNCESPTYGGPHGRTALHAALTDEDGYECMVLLLEKNKDLIKVAENNWWTAFHFVASNNLEEHFAYLFSVDKSVAYLADKGYKRTAIHVAAYRGHTSVLKKFLDNLPDVWESVDGNGQNILHIAVTQQHISMIDFILSGELEFDKQSALLIQRDKQGNTPLHLIAMFGFYFPQLHNTNVWKTDWDVVNNANFTPRDVFHQRQTATQSQALVVGITVDRTRIRSHWNQWIQDIARQQEAQRVPPVLEDPTQEDDETFIQRMREMANSHMIVAALITTVALTAGFAMPGGFDGNQGPNQGSAVLLRKSSFKTFMVADTVALLFSISSLFLYFLTQFNVTRAVMFSSVFAAVVCNVVSITAMMVAFIAGTSAVLSHSSALTLTVSIISSFFLFLVFYVIIRFLSSKDDTKKV